MERLTSYPGVADGDGFFERAYRTDGQVARVRFRPQQIEPSIAANIPLAPLVLAVQVSVSLIDQWGRVILIAGRGLVQEATSHTWLLGGDAPFDREAWLDEIARPDIERLSRAAAVLGEAEMLIVPPPIATQVEVPAAAVPMTLAIMEEHDA